MILRGDSNKVARREYPRQCGTRFSVRSVFSDLRGHEEPGVEAMDHFRPSSISLSRSSSDVSGRSTEPTLSREDRILSPVRLPFPWYWKHVGATLKASSFKAVTMLPSPTYIIAALG